MLAAVGARTLRLDTSRAHRRYATPTYRRRRQCPLQSPLIAISFSRLATARAAVASRRGRIIHVFEARWPRTIIYRFDATYLLHVPQSSHVVIISALALKGNFQSISRATYHDYLLVSTHAPPEASFSAFRRAGRRAACHHTSIPVIEMMTLADNL